MVGPASSDWLQNWERLTTERDVVSLFRISLLMRGSAFTLLAWLVIILNNAQQLFDFLDTAQHSALRARLHRGHAGHGWGDISFISWWSSSFALGSRCCQRRLKERNKAECGRMWKAVFWISLIGQLVYKWRHDNVQEYRQCQGMNVRLYFATHRFGAIWWRGAPEVMIVFLRRFRNATFAGKLYANEN